MKASKNTKVRIPRATTIMKGIETPEGFEREQRVETWTWGPDRREYHVLRLTAPGVEIEVHFDGGRESFALASGHVTFDTPLGKRTFDRYGVEDSFYVDNPGKWGDGRDPIAQANEEIRRVIEERIPEALERLARSEQLPDIPFSVTPEQKRAVTDRLKLGRGYDFVPAGMGTGYTLTTWQPARDPYAKRSPELAKFFDVPDVWVSTFDAD